MKGSVRSEKNCSWKEEFARDRQLMEFILIVSETPKQMGQTLQPTGA